MAQGTATMFDEFLKDLGTEVHNLPSDTIKAALVDNTITPTANYATPTWSDFSANEVSGSNYTAGGETLTGITWATAAGVTSLVANDVQWNIHASGPTDAYWLILVNTSAASSQCIGFMELDGPVSLQADNIIIEWPSGVVLKLTANP
jgi:hypothetical protein